MSHELDNFVCRCCGFCCSFSGYVLLAEGEDEKIAAFLNLDIYQFIEQYTEVVISRQQLTLTEQANGRCIFLQDDNLCRIQAVKPIQCTSFPYEWRDKNVEKHCAGFAALRATQE
ncbi:MAG: YkgJ family cysteine cluster protein [Kiritimatiellae bacterium]|nr:YkgJ family cysteine cluster protein [Kiritimatiellia bacterium]